MASISSRASGFWADDASSRRSASGHEYDEDEEEVLDREEQPLAGLGADDPNDFRTPVSTVCEDTKADG
jgi:predicted Ser/Thr protein kinase